MKIRVFIKFYIVNDIKLERKQTARRGMIGEIVLSRGEFIFY